MTARSLGHRMSRGAAWMIVFKVSERAISLVSMIVLARLLVPADFGLVVLASSLIALLELLGAFAFDIALIQQPGATRNHFNAVWTFKVLFGLAVCFACVCLSSLSGWLYADPRLPGVVVTLAVARAIGGFENVGVVAFRKELQFDREVAFLIAKRLLTSIVITLPLAFVLRSYWALAIGNVIGAFAAVLLSFVMHPYRPRLSFTGLRELLHFSKWLLLSSLMQFLHGRAADFIIGRAAGTPALGSFTLAQDIARMPAGEIAAPVHRAVFPGFVKLAQDRELLRQAYLGVASALMLMVMPAGVGLCLLAQPAVSLLLGSNWLSVVPIVQLLALNATINVLLGTAYHVNLAVGMSRSTSLVLGLHVLVSLPLMLWLVPAHGAQGAAMALLIASVVVTPVNLMLLAKAIRFGWLDTVVILARPCIGTLAMGAAVSMLRFSLGWPTEMTMQVGYAALVVTTGALVYAVTVMLMWRWQGEPDGAETRFAQALSRTLAASARMAFWNR